jgi:glyoxylase-like metal-dependent hydrolase (beta-lactamase superfamily II)
METVKINDAAYSIEDNGVRCLLFIGSERALLVDTGNGQAGSIKSIVASLTDKPVQLVITHADPDHTGNNAEFDAAYMHPSEMAYYYRNAAPDALAISLWEGDVIDIGGRRFDVILIPGHTPGSIALLDRENRIIITGDTISAGPVFMFGNTRSMTAYMESLQKLIGLKSEFDYIYPAHNTFPLPPDQIDKTIVAAKKFLAGELTPEEPPFPVPAKVYMYDGAGFVS